MKMRKLFSFLLALLTALSAALPARAAEGAVQVQDPASLPEESPAEGEVPDWLLEPEDVEQTPEPPADTAAPEDPVVPETPVIPETPENPEVPGEILPPAEPETPENPDTPEVPVVPEEPDQPVDPEIPEAPVIPEVPESPETPETPEVPETPVNPDDPAQPPDWLLPPEETPSLPAAPGADEPALLPPENAIAEEAPVINVLVPSSGRVVINPYCLPVELDGQTSTDQIVSAPLILQNLSTVPVSVSASVTGTVPPGSGVSFAAAQPVPDSPVKEIFLFAEFQPVSDPVLQPAWSGGYSDSTNQLLVGFQSTAKDNVLRLEAIGAVYSFGAMRLFGSAAVSPLNPWQAGDDIQASFVFSFTPIADGPFIEPSVVDDFVADTPVMDAPVTETPVTDTPVTDMPVFGESAPIPDTVPAGLPGWLFES